jgi:endonuclease/exonuclease/phosphatase (EEP) superfamily protein YafD
LAILVPVGTLTAVATAVGFFGGLSSLLDLASHFRIWYALTLAPVVAAAYFLKHRQLIAIAGAALAANLVAIAPLYLYSAGRLDAQDLDDTASVTTDAGQPGAEAGREGLHILLINVRTENANRQECARYINDSGAELAAVLEVDELWLAALERSAGSYDVVASEPRDDNYGLALLARREAAVVVDRARVFALLPRRSDRPAVEARVKWGEKSLTLLVLHAAPPTGLAGAELRDRQLSAAGEWAAGKATALVVGDLNTTLWSAPFRQLLATGSLRDSERGFGLQGTWRAEWTGPWRLPIDHVLHSPDLRTVDRWVGPDLNSDHRPLEVVIEHQ